jgi:seryl-tRNA synthetase
MLDIKILRKNPEIIRDSILKRNIKFDLDRLIEIDIDRASRQQELELLQTIRNKTSKEISEMSEESERQKKITEMKEVGEKIKKIENNLNEWEEEYKLLLSNIPNFLDPTAAIGPNEDANIIEKNFGTPRKFDFPIKTHYQIWEARWWIDIEKWAEVSGARFWYLKGDLVVLQFAILNYVISRMIEKWFTPIIPPYLVREKAMYGTWFFPADRSQIYEVNPGDDNLFLIGTSEVPITSYHSEEIVNVDTPIQYIWYSACFRREAGTYWKDMKGILRWHQFDKVEMVCFCRPEVSQDIHNKMVSFEEEIWWSLGIPFNRVNICSGDLGNPAMKKYDLEAWIPSENQYREVTSCSNIGSFQSRRLSIRYRTETWALDYVHTLNGI